MESVTDLFPEGAGYKTRVWATLEGRKEIEKVVLDRILDLFENQAERGFKDYKGKFLRPEDDSVWAFGTDGETDRICGYFVKDDTRKNFVVCGAWKGKAGRGNSRPHHADAIVRRTARVRREGVRFPETAA